MRYPFHRGVLCVGLLLLAGCGEAKSDKGVKAQIELMNAYAAEFELIAKKPSPAEAHECQKRIAKIESEMKENNLAMKKLPLVEVEAAGVKYKAEVDQARERLQKALKAIVPPKGKA